MNPDRNLRSRAELPLLSETQPPLPDWGTLADQAYDELIQEEMDRENDHVARG